jgi:hypothetical protein
MSSVSLSTLPPTSGEFPRRHTGRVIASTEGIAITLGLDVHFPRSELHRFCSFSLHRCVAHIADFRRSFSAPSSSVKQPAFNAANKTRRYRSFSPLHVHRRSLT